MFILEPMAKVNSGTFVVVTWSTRVIGAASDDSVTLPVE
jgi:hypothetical protein